jgi:ATP-dependent helicase HrpB
VLTTNIAETSLTIEGIEVVVDSGLVREGVFDSATSMTRLTTRRISKASARQREGRAGRLGPGYCYRLWSEEQDHRLVAHATPEILQADLAPLALQLLSWGVDQPADLAWLDTPPLPAFQQGLGVLETCGAVYRNREGRYQLTPQGVRMAQMPLHPRLAHMLLVGADINAQETACLLAAVGYTGGPFPYGYRAMGELAVFVFFGLAGTVGSRFVHDGTAPVAAGAGQRLAVGDRRILSVDRARKAKFIRTGGTNGSIWAEALAF